MSGLDRTQLLSALKLGPFYPCSELSCIYLTAHNVIIESGS